MIERIDHLVLTVRSIDVTCEFYTRVLGFQRIDTAGRPTALGFGAQKINVHEKGKEFEPKAHKALTGSVDICFISSYKTIEEVIDRLKGAGVDIIEGPVPRNGALGPMTSVYLRDPDLNLLELSVYPEGV